MICVDVFGSCKSDGRKFCLIYLMTDRQSSGRLLDFLKFVNHKTIFFFLFFLEAGKLSDYKYFVVVTNYQ